MSLFLLLLSCAQKTPPVLFPQPLPQTAIAPAAEFEPAEDECAKSMPFKPGESNTYIDDKGFPLCRAQIVPESKVFDLLNLEAEAVYWEKVSGACYERSEADRLLAQTRFNTVWYGEKEAKLEAQTARLVTPLAATTGILVGLGVGYAYAKLAP